MKSFSQCVGLTIALACTICFSDSAFGQSFSRSFGRTFGGGSSSAEGSQSGGPGQFSTDSTKSRNISVMDNGKKVSIIEDETGITVSVNGNRVRARNIAELKMHFPGAFRMYQKHMGQANRRKAQPDSKVILREELGKLRNEVPQLRDLIDRMLQSIPL